MILLGVWMRPLAVGTARRVGVLACSDPDDHGRFASEFRYDESWLRAADAFAIDPVSLPLRSPATSSENLFPPLAVFEDALPDDWGRALLIREHRLPIGRQGVPFLLEALGANALGALMFGGEDAPAPEERSADRANLDVLLAAAERWARGLPIAQAKLARLLAAGSSPGGARPKALIVDAGGHWIAKFPSRSRDEGLDVVGLEATAMALARRAGLRVPDTRLVDVGRRRVLLVRRFDVTREGGRRHMLSLRTLAKERPGRYVQRYSELAAIVRKVSDSPNTDVDELFRHMAFNAVIGNTDDHLKNFWMQHTGLGYRLTPAFDLVPDVGRRGEHALAFLYRHAAPSGADLLALAKQWGVRRASAIVGDVIAAARGFDRAARRLRVANVSRQIIARDVARRVAALEDGLP